MTDESWQTNSDGIQQLLGDNNQGAAITEWDALFPFRAHLLASEGTQLDHGGLLPLRHSLAQPQLPKAVLADGKSNMPADVGDCRGVRVTRVRIGLYAGALCAGPLVRESARTGLCWSVVLLHASAIEFVGGRRGSDVQEQFQASWDTRSWQSGDNPMFFPLTGRPLGRRRGVIFMRSLGRHDCGLLEEG